MARPRLFPARITVQFWVPAALLALVSIYKGGLAAVDWDLLLSWLYLSAPHLFVAAIAFWPSVRRSTIFFTLVALNVLLTSFCVVLALSKDPNAAMLFGFYLPACIAILALAPLVATSTRSH